jgi:hypothetical protein
MSNIMSKDSNSIQEVSVIISEPQEKQVVINDIQEKQVVINDIQEKQVVINDIQEKLPIITESGGKIMNTTNESGGKIMNTTNESGSKIMNTANKSGGKIMNNVNIMDVKTMDSKDNVGVNSVIDAKSITDDKDQSYKKIMKECNDGLKIIDTIKNPSTTAEYEAYKLLLNKLIVIASKLDETIDRKFNIEDKEYTTLKTNIKDLIIKTYSASLKFECPRNNKAIAYADLTYPELINMNFRIITTYNELKERIHELQCIISAQNNKIAELETKLK